jgi:Zn-dependent peptidase ImmA (M78 family)/transcriptional regulator with XRE-family HTH domain
MIYGERVKQVRQMHRLTQAGLAEDVPTLTQYQLSRIEGHQAQPDEETTTLLALACGVTPDFLRRLPHPDLPTHSPHLRARSRLTEREKNAATQWLRLIHEQHRRMAERARPLAVRLPRRPGADPPEAAAEVRAILGFDPTEPLPYLLLAVERAGVTLLGVPAAADTLDAFCVWHDDEPVIGLLADAPPDRLRFSVAHELGHLVLHRSSQAGRDIEAEADAFAAELLTPLVALADQMPARPTLSALTMLKTHWGVSIKSLVRRAKELGAVDQDRAISLYKQISARGWNRAEPGYVQPEKPRAFRKLAEICFGPGPNVERLARDAAWSSELAMLVLRQHATSDELPHSGPRPAPARPADLSNVIRFPVTPH